MLWHHRAETGSGNNALAAPWQADRRNIRVLQMEAVLTGCTVQTQRQLQVSLEAHGKYISSLIDADTNSVEPRNDPLLDELPSLELDLEDLPNFPLQQQHSQSVAPLFSQGWDATRSADTNIQVGFISHETISFQ